ncbi:MAG TPA: hypothetical protein VGF38_16320 [Ktedonobacterales bacterium]|jgi:hypothetical protein
MMSDFIAVTFVDQKTGKAFAVSDIPLEQLPESFAPATQLTIADVEWQVITAEPMTADEFARTGKLTLTLEKIMMMPTRDVRYSQPTITDSIPVVAPGTNKAIKRALTIHEDDWRQIEMISAGYAAEMREQFEGIRRIYEKSSDGVGFLDIYVRSLIEPAIVGPVRLDEIETAIPAPFETFDGIAYEQGDALIAGGFAYAIGPIALFGIQKDGLVQALCLRPRLLQEPHTSHLDALAAALALLMARHDFMLVDWRRMLELPADASSIAKYLRLSTAPTEDA